MRRREGRAATPAVRSRRREGWSCCRGRVLAADCDPRRPSLSPASSAARSFASDRRCGPSSPPDESIFISGLFGIRYRHLVGAHSISSELSAGVGDACTGDSATSTSGPLSTKKQQVATKTTVGHDCHYTSKHSNFPIKSQRHLESAGYATLSRTYSGDSVFGLMGVVSMNTLYKLSSTRSSARRRRMNSFI
ncbi:hypothetical protein EVAR_43572_1 [Eumeta japonica]|uniref:Uncharacterized protein n=1 Tax=Eumeta variegata TaxID=151549 RepID=A0A4C1XHF9_EUMVA|nr:hypothetical protein EVAR_43572_1 [Eumeta japonica]